MSNDSTSPVRVTVASVGEVMGGHGIMAPRLRTRNPGHTVVGPATTCRMPAGTNLAIYRALEAAPRGGVLVATAVGDGATGLWGGMITRAAVAHGLAGVIADGAVRDTRDFRASGLPVWSAEVVPRGAAKSDPGELNVDVVCGGVIVRPGDTVVADDDGIAVVPADRVDEVMELVRERELREAAWCERLDAGESPFDVLGLPRA